MSDWRSRATPVDDSPKSDWRSRAVSVDAPTEPQTSATQAGIEGFGQGALMGYLPQAQAGVEMLTPNPSQDVDDDLRAQGFKISQPDDSYVNLRDQNVKRMALEGQEHPVAQAVGNVGGAVAAAPMMGGALKAVPGLGAPASGLLGRLTQAAGGGAIMGAAQNPGDEEGKIDPVQAGARFENAKTGAKFGVAAQAVGEAAGKTIKIVKGMPDFLRDFAENRGAAATGLSKSQAKNAIKSDPSGQEGKQLKELGRYVLDNKLVQVGDSIEDVANRSGELKQKLGAKIGAVYDEAVQKLEDPSIIKKTEFVPKDLSSDYLSGLSKKVKGTPQGNETLNAGKKLVANFNQGGEKLDMNKMQDFKAALDDMIFKSDQAFKKSGQQTVGIEAAKEMRTFIKQRMDDALGAIDKAFGMTLGEDIKSLNKHYSMASKVNSISKDRLAGEMGNNFLSLTDKMAAMGGASVGATEGYKHGGIAGAVEGGILGAGAGLVSKAARTYGRPLMTIGADRASGLLAKTPEAIGRIGGNISSALTSSPGTAGLIGAGSGSKPGLLLAREKSREADRSPARKYKK